MFVTLKFKLKVVDLAVVQNHLNIQYAKYEQQLHPNM